MGALVALTILVFATDPTHIKDPATVALAVMALGFIAAVALFGRADA